MAAYPSPVLWLTSLGHSNRTRLPPDAFLTSKLPRAIALSQALTRTIRRMVCSTYNFTCAVTNITLDFISEHVASAVTGS
jgi:hypothetical protein